MKDQYDLVVRGGICLMPGGRIKTDLWVRSGRIALIGESAKATAAASFDAAGLHVLPGVIDSQVHLREPGLEHKEDIETGTSAAAMGGVTAVFDMPNTHPSTLAVEDLADKVERAAGRAWCDIAFFGGAARENVDDLAELETRAGCSGIKIFMGSSTGSLLVPDDETLRRVLSSGFRRMAVHAEDEYRLRERRKLVEPEASVEKHPHWRDEETALAATKRVLSIARSVGRRVHILHVSTGVEMEVLADYRDLATCEVTPQHLTLVAPDCYKRLGTRAQMNPPIRGEADRAALWRALDQGVVDVIGSDHAPHTLEEKDQPYPRSPSGMPGVQTLLPLMLDHVHHGRLSLERLVDLTSAGPARVYGIAGKGSIAVGYDADFSIVDLKAKARIENAWIKSRCGWTPFDGMEVHGWPKATIVRGEIAMREGVLVGRPAGKPVRFSECLRRE